MKRNLIALLLAASVFGIGTAAHAQGVDIGGMTMDDGLSQRVIQVIASVTAITLVPAGMMMVTCFPFMLTVLVVVRSGLGLQQSPPNILLITIALFLTYFVMEPVFLDIWENALKPLNAGQINIELAYERTQGPLRGFITPRIDVEGLYRLAETRGMNTADLTLENAPFSLLVPSFILSELTLAFQVGFVVYLPFLIIDLIVSAILMSMGMMMVPPSVVSLPFKLGFFVVSNGWSLLAEGLVTGYMG
ncbi:flagellar type III secretion system pore protein FliP [Donghicola mangrovi]|uniref:Flagellar biosynthetic protein FliP n=1 Tax=Donghicola mangrovi TaxID=2729614 RepID=A0A850Q008_9RHOB|nr:flagellar type III secretion system pore protein FliP [Donghicola mangrovi]NVO22426.1 flagellar biosynthetic protein FliP [Donghicola mangrovi]